MSCIGRRTDYDGWSDRSIEEDARLEVNSVVEVRLPPTASSGKRLQVNSNHSDVYEAAAWVRARVLRPAAATATVLVGADADSAALDQSTSADTTLHFGACEFELLYPDVVSFQTHSAASGHNAAETVVGGSSIAGLSADDEEVPPPRQLSFSEQRPASAQRPFTVTWHLSGPRRMLNSSSRNIRMAKTADPLDQAYIKGVLHCIDVVSLCIILRDVFRFLILFFHLITRRPLFFVDRPSNRSFYDRRHSRCRTG